MATTGSAVLVGGSVLAGFKPVCVSVCIYM